MIDGELLGQANLLRKLAKAGERAQASVDKRAEGLANDMAAEIRRRAPVDKGGLRDSVRVEPGDEPGTFEVKAGGTPETMREPGRGGRRGFALDVAVMVEYGTAPHITDHPPAGKYRRKSGDRFRKHPGTPRQPFFTPVVNEYGSRIRRELGDAAAEATIQILED